MRSWSDDFDAAPRDAEEPPVDSGGDPLRILPGGAASARSRELATFLLGCRLRFPTAAKQPQPPAGTD